MAVGDIVRFGALYVDGVEFGTSGYSSTAYGGTIIQYRDAAIDERKRNFIYIKKNVNKRNCRKTLPQRGNGPQLLKFHSGKIRTA